MTVCPGSLKQMTWGDYISYSARAKAAEAQLDVLREQLNASAEQNVIDRAERDALREALEEINTLCEVSGVDSLVARAARKGLAALEHPPLVKQAAQRWPDS